MSKLISIIIPTFNRANLLRCTLDSILVQTYQNWECLIVDDSSTDNTHDLVIKFTEKDKRFRFFNNTRKKGAQGARNTGILNARGEYITFFDSDDYMFPNRLTEQISYLESNPDCDVCICHSQVLNDSNQICGSFTWKAYGNIINELLIGTTYVDFNCGIIRKEALSQFGFLDEDCPSFQEWDTHLRLAQFAKYGTIETQLIKYYKRKSGRISNDICKELIGYGYIYAKHKELWINQVGSNLYYLKILLLTTSILKQDQKFQIEIMQSNPDININFNKSKFSNYVILFLEFFKRNLNLKKEILFVNPYIRLRFSKIFLFNFISFTLRLINK